MSRQFPSQAASAAPENHSGLNPRLLSFPPELLEQIIKQVGRKEDLSNVRLSCKTLGIHAFKELFKEAFLSPERMDSWNKIAGSDTIRLLPRQTVIYTRSDIEDHGAGYYREEEDFDEEAFEEALSALSKLPNLDSLEIGFTPECIGRNADYWQEVAEDVSQREEMLELIFQAVKDRAANQTNRPIRKLTITNLQNCPLPDFTSSDLFRDVMSQLEELHISLTQEYNEAGPDHDYTKVELRTFPSYFCSDWLQPIANNLKALSIYSRADNWGPFPGYFDPSGIAFPKLETLALGYYTFAHDDDLDWILAIKSLRKLILHNCMINSWMRIYTEHMTGWDVQTHDWADLPGDGSNWAQSFSYGGRWAQYFDRISSGLPNLVDFRFDQASSYGDEPQEIYNINNRSNCGVRIFPERYICFDNGILPTHWPEAESDGSMHSWLDRGFPINRHKENLEADQESVERLLAHIRKSRV